MLKCVDIVALSSDYLDSQLCFSDGLAMRSHLAMCHNCRRFVRQMRLTLRALQQLPEPQLIDLQIKAQQLAALAKQPS